MDNIFYERLIKEGKRLDDGSIRIVIPCAATAIRSHNVSLGTFIRDSKYKLITSRYDSDFRKILAVVKVIVQE